MCIRELSMIDPIATAVDMGLATRATAGPREVGAKLEALLAGRGGAP